MTQRVATTALWSLAGANLLALLASATAAACYARWLDSSALVLWAAALAVARAGLLLLDGGIKTALVRRADLPDRATLRRLVRLSAGCAMLLSSAVAVVAWTLWRMDRLGAGEAVLLATYTAAYLLPYPPQCAALARLERQHRFGPVGRAEGASVLIEFVLPAALVQVGTPWWCAFAAAVLLARGLRSVWIVHAARALVDRATTTPGPRAGAVLHEGLGVQVVAVLSMLRDQTHLWLLAPWFGSHWAGMYTLALTACALVGQASVQTASRIALPWLRGVDPALRWPQVLAQTRLLALCTLPPLALLPAWLAHADAAWWGGRWADAVLLAPWLALRMLAGVATTSLGAWLMVARSPWRSAGAHAAWTACEVALAALALHLAGPTGLALAAAFTAWLGVLLFLSAADPQAPLWRRFAALALVLLARPSSWAALALAAWAHALPQMLPWASLLLPLVWLTEGAVRQRLRAAWRPRLPAGASHR